MFYFYLFVYLMLILIEQQAARSLSSRLLAVLFCSSFTDNKSSLLNASPLKQVLCFILQTVFERLAKHMNKTPEFYSYIFQPDFQFFQCDLLLIAPYTRRSGVCVPGGIPGSPNSRPSILSTPWQRRYPGRLFLFVKYSGFAQEEGLTRKFRVKA